MLHAGAGRAAGESGVRAAPSGRAGRRGSGLQRETEDMEMTPDNGAAGPRAGSLSVRLARDAAEVDAAQALRFAVFYGEMGARADAATLAARRDRDAYDAVAEHLVVIDAACSLPCGVVGTYRLIDEAAAARAGGFYSQGEFDISALLAAPGRKLELGRSCVHAGWRGGPAMQLLWRGLSELVLGRGIALMFGCASLPGTDAAAVAEQLAYLRQAHLAPRWARPVALAGRRVAMGEAMEEDAPRARAALPPLLKGYLRLGGWVGDGAVLDAQFNTIDVAVVVRTEAIAARYARHYGQERRAA
jgi:putative hemolysin